MTITSAQKINTGNLRDSIKTLSVNYDAGYMRMDTDFKSRRPIIAKAATYHLGLRGKREKEVA